MAKLPRIMYNGNLASNVNYNGNDVLNVVMDGKTVFHKHKEGVCKTYHPASDVYCNNQVEMHQDWHIDSTHNPSIYVYWRKGGCSVCGAGMRDAGSGWYSEVPAFSPYYVTCGNKTGTNPAYYSYSCGFDAT